MRHVFLLAGILASIPGVGGAQGPAACCSITAIDANSGVVSA